MAGRSAVDPAALRAAVLAVADWAADPTDDTVPTPPRPLVAAAVRLSARALAAAAPGASVEVRVPPFVAVQAVAGPRHTRGTPPNVVETDARTWLALVVGTLDLGTARARGALTASGNRATDVAHWLPLLPLLPR